MEVQVIRRDETIKNRLNKNKFITKLRVAAYCRVSSDKEDQINSYQSQLKYYNKKICENLEWTFVEVYADEAISGTQTKKRNDFLRMISDAMAGKIDLILTKSISRFARNTVDTLNYVRMLKEKGIGIIFEEENINTLEMAGELLLTILSSVAQQESETISNHVKLGLKMKMERGELIGFNRCLGYNYDSETKQIYVNEKEAETVKYIFQRYLEGVGGQTIARELTQLNAKTINGKTKWTDSAVLGIIKNEKYVGDVRTGKTFTADPITHKRYANFGEVDQYYIKNHHESIIDREIYEEAQKILNMRNGNKEIVGRRKGNYSRKYKFSSRVYCGFCGQVYTRRNLYATKNTIKKMWQCMNLSKKGKYTCPNSKAIREEIIENCFVDMYNIISKNNTKVLETFFEDVFATLKQKNPKYELNKIKQEQEKTKEKIDRLTSLFINNQIEDEKFNEKRKYYIARLENLEKEEKYVMDDVYDEKSIINGIKRIRETFENNKELKEFDIDIFEALISRVIIGEIENEEKKPYTITFLLKSNYDNIGKPKIENCENPILLEFDSNQKYASFDLSNSLRLEKNLKNSIRVKVKFDV